MKPVADQNGKSDNGYVPGERIDRIANHGLSAGGGSLPMRVNAPPFRERTVSGVIRAFPSVAETADFPISIEPVISSL